MKKTILLIILSVFSFSAINAAVNWELKDGKLTVWGTDMPDYGNGFYAPWSEQREEIKEIVIKEGITKIGDCAFYGCSNLTSVEIPTSVKSIGLMSFGDCTSLPYIRIPNSVESIGIMAFFGCSSLTYALIPESVTKIDFQAFYNCVELSWVYIFVNKDLKFGSESFASCNNLDAISFFGETLPASVEGWGVNSNKVYVSMPQELKDKYKTASPWNDFEANEHLEGNIYLTDNKIYTNEDDTYGTDVCYVRDFQNTEWQALYIPFKLNYGDWKDDFDIAYINGIRQFDTDDDGDIDQTVMDIIKIKNKTIHANYPYLIRAKKTGKQALFRYGDVSSAEENSISCSTTIDKYTFTGTYKFISANDMYDEDFYAMGGGKLIQSDGTTGLKPFRWYMNVEFGDMPYQVTADRAKVITINVIDEGEETTTGIMDLQVTNVKSPVSDSSVYDLNGRKMNEKNLKPGLYIKNGKKIVIK